MTEPGVIEAEEPRCCMACGAAKETRPYGPGGREVCFPCFQGNPEWLEEGQERALALMEGRPPADVDRREA